MKQDDIIRMAKECGFAFDSLGGTHTTGSLSRNLEDFANLVAAAERERITKLLDYLNMKAQPWHNYYKHVSVEINRDPEEGKNI